VFLGIGILIILLLTAFGNYIGPGHEKIFPAVAPPTASELLLDAKPSSEAETAAKKIGEKIAASLIDLNPQGPTNFENERVIKALNPKKIADEVVKEELAKVSQLDIGLNNIKLGKITTLTDSSPPAAENYLKTLQQILKDRFTIKEINWQNFGSNDLNLLINAHQQAIAELYQLAVPANLAPIHQKQILLLEQKKIIITKLRNVETNPLEALAALNYDGEIDQKFSQLKSEILDFVKTNNLKI